jgi:hypothetical protein
MRFAGTRVEAHHRDLEPQARLKMHDEKEGTLAWHRADLEARRAAFKKMLEDESLTNEQRELWDERLANVELVLADMKVDPIGYTAWVLAERHAALRRQTDRFTQ